MVALALDQQRASSFAADREVVGALCFLLTNGKAIDSKVAAAHGLWLLLSVTDWEVASEAMQRGTVPVLLEMLQPRQSEPTKAAAARAIANLCMQPAAQTFVGELPDAINLLLAILHHPGSSAAQPAAAAVANLCRNPFNCARAASSGGVQLLVAMLATSPDWDTTAGVVRALLNISAASDDRRTLIAGAGGITELLRVIKRATHEPVPASLSPTAVTAASKALETTCYALANLMQTEALRRMVGDAEAVPLLVQLAIDSTPDVEMAARAPLLLLASLPDKHREAVCLIELRLADHQVLQQQRQQMAVLAGSASSLEACAAKGDSLKTALSDPKAPGNYQPLSYSSQAGSPGLATATVPLLS